MRKGYCHWGLWLKIQFAFGCLCRCAEERWGGRKHLCFCSVQLHWTGRGADLPKNSFFSIFQNQKGIRLIVPYLQPQINRVGGPLGNGKWIAIGWKYSILSPAVNMNSEVVIHLFYGFVNEKPYILGFKAKSVYRKDNIELSSKNRLVWNFRTYVYFDSTTRSGILDILLGWYSGVIYPLQDLFLLRNGVSTMLEQYNSPRYKKNIKSIRLNYWFICGV